MKTNILRYRWQNEQQQQQNSSARAADSAENKSQSCYLEHTSLLLHSISSIDWTLKLPRHPVVCKGRKIKFSHPASILPQSPPLKNFRASKPRCAAQLSLQRVLHCVYMLYQRTIKLLNIQHKHTHTNTHARYTKKKTSDYIGNNFICPYQIRTEIYTFRKKDEQNKPTQQKQNKQKQAKTRSIV